MLEVNGRSGNPNSAIRRLRNLALAACFTLSAFAPAAFAADPPAKFLTDVQVGKIEAALASAAQQAPAVANEAPKSESRVDKLLKGALALLGTPYRWGGTTTSGFDCSGLVGYVFRTALGVDLPRVSRDMANRGEQVSRDQLVKGDLVFFSRGRVVDHVGIYIGEGKFVHAPRTGRDVSVSNLDGYWAQHFVTARRVTAL